jgi:hypothetical protein
MFNLGLHFLSYSSNSVIPAVQALENFANYIRSLGSSSSSSGGDVSQNLIAVFVDSFCLETFEDNVESYRDLFSGSLTLFGLAAAFESHQYPVRHSHQWYQLRHVAEDDDRLRMLHEWIVGGDVDDTPPIIPPAERTAVMREVFQRLPTVPAGAVQPVQLPRSSYLVTMLHVGLVRINIPSSREVRIDI